MKGKKYTVNIPACHAGKAHDTPDSAVWLPHCQLYQTHPRILHFRILKIIKACILVPYRICRSD